MKKTKRFISILLSIVMLFSITTSLNYKPLAAEGTDYLSDDDIMWFTSKFLYTLNESEKAAYGDVLKKISPDVEWSGDEYEKVKICVDKVQGYWNKISPLLPKKITDNEFVKLGNNLCGYFSCTIGVLKNAYYITNEDTNNIQKAYHYLKSFNSICSTLGWSLGPLSMVLSAVSATLPIADLLYSSICQESLGFYELQLQMAYWDPSKPELPTPEEVMVQPAFQQYINDENYINGLNALYIKYSLMQMADSMKQITVEEPINEKGYFKGRTYQVFDMSMTWTEAKEYCENLGGHLVTITDSEEQKFVGDLALLGIKDTYWLGGTDYKAFGQWEWITGETFEYENWASGEPTNGCAPGPEYYLEMIKSNGKWNDGELEGQGSSGIYALCNHGFICEWDNYIDPYPTMNDEHNYVQTVIAPTCTTDGYTINQCSDCELRYYSNNVSKLGHDYVLSKTVSATCTASGYDLYICLRCNATEKKNIVNALGHNYIFQSTTDATCENQGYDNYICSRCNAIEKRNFVDATGHNYEVTSNTATCTEAGIKTSVCSKCGDTTTAEVSALGHSYNNVYTAPTCIESGGYTNTCTRCGDVVYNVYEKNGHDYGECIGEDYINTIYTTEGKFKESISSSVNYYGKTYYTTSYISNSIRKIKVTYPQQIRIDINNNSAIEKYNFYVKKYAPLSSNIYLNYIFSYNQNTGRSPDQSAIPYTDKNGNLINMKYIDYKDNGVWNNGEYLVENNNIVDVNGSVVSSSFSETRPHIVYTKEEALESGIMNNDGTVNVIILDILGDNEISFSSGVDGIYTTIFNASANSYVSALKCDNNVKLSAGAYNIPLCFYSSKSYTTGNLMLKIYDADKIVKKTPATETTDEIVTYTCMDCGEQHIETSSLDISNFKIKTVSLSLASSITMNFKVLKTAVADFENPYIQFTRNGNTITVSEYTEQGDYLVFAYKDIAPQAMNDTVTAVLKAEHNTIEYSSSPLEYSVSKYAYTMLDKCSDDQYAKLRTLLVDLLNYGAEAQSYQNYKTDDLVNSKLTDIQKAWASTDELNLTDVTNKNYSAVENALVEWKSASLQLNNSVAVRYKFTAQSVDNLSVKVECGASQWEYGADSFTDNGDSTYYFLFNDLNADKMSEDIFITVMNGDTAVSNTMRFSVESYSKKVQDLMPNSSLQKLTDAMMRYGKAAASYA